MGVGEVPSSHRRPPCRGQEHKQHSALCHEIDEWMEKTREKLAETAPLTSRHSELLTKLHTVQSLRASVEQGQKKLRSVSRPTAPHGTRRLGLFSKVY